MARTLTQTCRTVVRLHQEVQNLDQKIKKRKEELAKAKQALLEIFQRNGIDATSTKTHTLSLARQVFGTLKKSDDAISALKEQGLDWLVKETVSAQTLSAWVREQCSDEADKALPVLPGPLQPHITVYEKFDVKVRRR